MAYDNEPRRVVREKAALLEECALRRDLLVFGHDPEIAAARVRSEADGTFSIEPI